MSLLQGSIPAIDVAPEVARPSEIGRHLRAVQASRRTVLKAIMGAGMTIGLSAVDLLPGARPAYAGWYSTYSHWSDCHGYFEAGTTCTPSSWYISSNNCNGAGYHRDDSASGTCYAYNYDVKFTCGGRNAWHWASNRKRCSDGHYFYQDCGGGYRNTNSICRASY